MHREAKTVVMAKATAILLQDHDLEIEQRRGYLDDEQRMGWPQQQKQRQGNGQAFLLQFVG